MRIYVAGINYFWMSNLKIVEKCTRNALLLAKNNNLKSIAFPLIGSGVGGLKEKEVIHIMENVFSENNWDMEIIVVKKNK